MRRINAMTVSRMMTNQALSWRGQSVLRWAVLCVATFVLGHSAWAETGLSVQLVPETTAIVPGQPFRVGLWIQHQPGWHTYWQQPGIVGVPTQIRWQLPPGFKAGPLEFPEPQSVLMFHIRAQGFERDVLLQTQITPPADLPIGPTITLQGQASWMCCGNTCHPAQKKLTLTLPTAVQAQPQVEWQPLFEKERQAYARPSTAWTASAIEQGLVVTLKITPQAQARPFSPEENVRFFTLDGWINSDEPQAQSLAPDGSLTLTLHRAEVFLGETTPTQLHGILQREGGWEQGKTWRSLALEPELVRP